MSFPDPVKKQDAFIAHLKEKNLTCCLPIIEKYQSRPGDVSDERLDQADASTWCQEMDIVLGKHPRKSQGLPKHRGLFGKLSTMCSQAVTEIEKQLEAHPAVMRQSEDDACAAEEVESQLSAQQEAGAAKKRRKEKVCAASEVEAQLTVQQDTDAASQHREEAHARLGMERLELQDRQDQIMEEREREPLLDVEMEVAGKADDNDNDNDNSAGDNDKNDNDSDEKDEINSDDDDNNNDNKSDTNANADTNTNSRRSSAEQHSRLSRQQIKQLLEKEARAKVEEVTHKKACNLCALKGKKKCVGPVGFSCNLCWTQHKSCSNGRSRDQVPEMTEKLESTSQPMVKKRKEHPPVEASTSKKTLDDTDDNIPPSTQSLRKRPRTSGTPSDLVFDGVLITTKPRRSSRNTKTTSNKTIESFYRRLGKDHAAMAKTYKEFADAMKEL